ncbi:amino acid ABC transporter permease [Thermohalobaculum sediminis]|uniref:amino acid ABC transporter permease n=1 Tax=Thermohalobaculum sediminis TaxID=2939436 RepID=UPI0029E818E6|nr:ABC transporter permease subunit [Limibaculum sediminis]
MSDTAQPSGPSFRIDMLWNDSRYRSTFIQVVALFLVILAVMYLFQNVVENLAALGKTFGFDFMTQPAGYDINQRLIDYTSRSTHSTAAVVGILNTLMVAVVGCVLATLIGVTAGVARLSKNWVVARLMTVYIEGVRNVPVLIQILLFAAIFDEALPAPSAFRGEDATASMWLGEMVAATNRGFYFPMPVWLEGSFWVVVAFFASILGAVWFGRWANERQQDTGEALPVLPIQAGIVAGGTLLVFLVAGIPIGLDYPALKGFNFQGGLYVRNSYMALTLALALYTGAFIAENVRAGIQAVSKGQTEAAFALGLRPNRTMNLVILPQALRVIIPPLISQYLNLTKNSSLALLVGYMDVTGTLMGITLNQTGKEFETLFLGMAFYLSVSLSVAAIMNLYNEQVKLVERTSAVGMGFSVLDLFAGVTGKWEVLKKGDATMKREYGIRGLLNLFVVFYAVALALMVDYTFLAEITATRPSYFEWSGAKQIATLLMLIALFATLATCLFKNARFIDLAVMDLLAFIFAVAVGWPFGQLVEGVSGAAIVAIGLGARLAIIGYTIFGERPNLTFFHRVRRA